jgi:hypothetical protein
MYSCYLETRCGKKNILSAYQTTWESWIVDSTDGSQPEAVCIKQWPPGGWTQPAAGDFEEWRQSCSQIEPFIFNIPQG